MGQEKEQTINTLNDFFVGKEAAVSLESLPVPLIVISIDDGLVVFSNKAAKNTISNCKVGQVLKGLLHNQATRNHALSHIEKDGIYKVTKKIRTEHDERALRFIVTREDYFGAQHFYVYVEKRSYTAINNYEDKQLTEKECSRAEFLDKLDQCLRNIQANEESCVLVVDVDRLRVVNEKYGFKAGDHVLEILTSIINNELSKGSFLGRLSGNEFGIYLSKANYEQGDSFANRVRRKFTEHEFSWGGEQIELTTSIGLVPLQKDDNQLDRVLCDLDLALHTAKENGRNCVHCSKVDDTMMALQTDTMYFAMHIEDSLQKNKFELFAQPIVSLNDTTSNKHFEILLRSFDPKIGEYISSQELIHAAESLEMITKIDRWVCQTVFKLMGEKFLQDKEIPTISINLSGHTIVNAAFSEEIINLAKQYKVPTQYICFEITESVALKSVSRAQKFISALKEEGFRFALDDFGVGYCSFNYLQQFDVDIVKIDGVFVSTMLDNDTQFAMVKAIADVARTMNIETVAEFIENPEVIKALQELGVDYGQGFIFGKPEPLSNLI